MTEKAREAAERIRKGIEEMNAEKATYATWVEGSGIKATQYQGAGKPARANDTTPMSTFERAAILNVPKRKGRSNLDPEVAQIYSPK